MTATAAQSPDPLADLRPNYAERLRARVAGLSAFLQEARQGNLAEFAVSENHRCVHSMISSAAIFGHPELSRAARVAEQAFEQRTQQGDRPLISSIEALLLTADDVLNVYQTPNIGPLEPAAR